MAKRNIFKTLLWAAFLVSLTYCQPVVAQSALTPNYWQNVQGEFKHFRNFMGNNQQSVTNYTWEVPAGVTRLMIECWGGGAASRQERGGEGGGYAMAIVNILPGTTLELSVGWGGRGDASVVDRFGQSTNAAWIVNTSTFYIRALGGILSSDAGQFFLPGGSYWFSQHGNAGQPSESYYSRKGFVTNTVVSYCGAGGSPYGFPSQGSAGSNYTNLEGTNTLDTYHLGADGGFPAGGAGGKQASNPLGIFQNGGAGMVLVRW